jgi:hypothetical protein
MMESKRSLLLQAFAVTLLGLATSAAQSPFATRDPLFLRMEGHWSGQGTSTYPISGRKTQIAADVESAVSLVNGQERLTSTNQVTESEAGAAPRSYETVYWIEAEPETPGAYTLGYTLTGQSAPVTSTGIFGSDLIFATDQSLGNDYLIHSETQFTDSGSTYTQTATNGATVISKTVIEYQRAPGNN